MLYGLELWAYAYALLSFWYFCLLFSSILKTYYSHHSEDVTSFGKLFWYTSLEPSKSKWPVFLYIFAVQLFSWVQFFATPWTIVCQVPCSSPPTRACSNSCPLSQWCHLTISSSVIHFSSCLQSFPAFGFFPMNQLFTSSGQRIGASASASVILMNIQSWVPSGLTGLISLQSKGLSRVFLDTTVRKDQFFGTQFLYIPNLTSIHDYWKNRSFD